MKKPRFKIGSRVKIPALERRGDVVEVMNLIAGEWQYKVAERDGTRRLWGEDELVHMRSASHG